MAFLDQLRQANVPMIAPTPGLELGAPQSSPISDTLNAVAPFISRMRNQQNQDARDMMLFQQVHSPMPDIQGGRIRALADPSQMNTVYNPGMSEFQKASLGQDQQKIDLEKGKAKTAERVGDEKLDVLTGRLALDKEKSDQIFETKTKELEQKTSLAEKNLELAKQRLEQNRDSTQATAAYHAAQIEATNARHALDLAQRDRTLAVQSTESAARIKELEDRIAGRNTPDVTNETLKTDKDGNVIGKEIVKGKEKKRISIVGPGGKTGSVDEGDEKNLPSGWKVK